MSDEPPNSSNEHLHPARAFRNNKHTVSDIGFADERVRVAIYASLSRVIEVAPIENKMRSLRADGPDCRSRYCRLPPADD